MRALIETFDWASTSLGPMAEWPVSLKSMMAMVLAAEQPMLLWWGDDLIQIYNDAFAPSLGVDRHPAALGQRAMDCWQDVWAIVGDQIARVLSRGTPVLMENALVPIRRNGRIEEVYWNYTYTPAFDDESKIAGVLIICTETTARVLAERRERMLNQFRASTERCTLREEVLEQARKAALSNPADIRFLRIDDSASASVSEEPAAAFRLADSEGKPGSRVVFGLSEQLPFDDAYRRFLQQFTACIGEAITQAENVRKYEIARADRDRLLLDAPVGTAVLVGEELIYQLANQAYCDIVGREQITGSTFAEVFPELVGGDIHNIFLSAYRTGTPYRSDEALVRLRISGCDVLQDKYYSFNLAPLRSVAGGVYGLMVIAVDITPQVSARKEIERLNQDLIAASRAKDEFLAMLGHELRNPLAPIRAAAELLQLAGLDEARVRRSREVIVRQVKHMTHLIDDLLDVSRVTRGLIKLANAPVDCRDIAADAAEQVAPLIQSRGQQLSIECPADNVRVMGDAKRLVQILANLLTNAARYTPEGGRIRLEIEALPAHVLISVIDNGIGMAADLVGRVFDLFTQAERSSDRSSGGLGLGLALVKGLVELHGGRVTCFSEGAGKGSSFVVRLPRLNDPVRESPPRHDAPQEPPAGAPLRILIVDDNADAATMLCVLLESTGHEVSVEHEPLRALARASEIAPHVCLLDIGLPGMDGFELARRLRAAPVTAGSVLIAVTGYGQAHDRKKTGAAGFAHHLVKPIDTEKLMAILADVGQDRSLSSS